MSTHRRGEWARVLFAFAGAVGLVAVAACGSSASTSSSRPAYCSDRTNLQKSVKGLTSLSPSAGVSGLEAQVNKVKTIANNLANATKSDFPSQSNALNSSITALENSARSLASNPSAANIGTVTTDASNVVTAARNLVNATNAKCG
jgi:flagellar basal body rod protein FlgC